MLQSRYTFFNVMCIFLLRSNVSSNGYDSSKEDSQNPFPPPMDIPPPKQKIAASVTPTPPSQPRRADSQMSLCSGDDEKKAKPVKPRHADTQETLVSETPTRVTGKTLHIPQQVQAALQRAATVDQESWSERKNKAKALQNELQAEHEKCKAKAAANIEELAKTNTNEKGATSKRKLIDLSSPAAKLKPKKLTKEDKAKAAADKKQAAYEMKDHDTARSSTDPMPGAEPEHVPKPKAKTAAKAKSKASSTPKASPEKTIKKVQSPKVKAKAKAAAKATAKAKSEASSTPKASPSSKKQPAVAANPPEEDDDQEASEAGDPKAVKKEAHKLYMRFWRSVTKSHCLRFAEHFVI